MKTVCLYGHEGSNPPSSAKNKCRMEYILHLFFIQVADLVYHRRKAYIITLQRVYHHRRCIPLRLDDIQNFVLMICNFCEIDDIQGSRLDLLLSKQEIHPIGWIFCFAKKRILGDSNAVKKQHSALFLNGDRRFLQSINLCFSSLFCSEFNQ